MDIGGCMAAMVIDRRPIGVRDCGYGLGVVDGVDGTDGLAGLFRICLSSLAAANSLSLSVITGRVRPHRRIDGIGLHSGQMRRRC